MSDPSEYADAERSSGAALRDAASGGADGGAGGKAAKEGTEVLLASITTLRSLPAADFLSGAGEVARRQNCV